jgi:hypothetical protein
LIREEQQQLQKTYVLTMELQDERRSSGEVDTERAAAATEDLLTMELQDK